MLNFSTNKFELPRRLNKNELHVQQLNVYDEISKLPSLS